MTTVSVYSGACGHIVTIQASKGGEGKFSISLDSQCEMVQQMLGDIAVLDQYAVLAGFQNNPVYVSAAKHLKHVACPVPSGILKALETEAGLNVRKDATIAFKPAE